MPIMQAESDPKPSTEKPNGPFHDSHLSVTQTVSRGEEGRCPLSTSPPPLPDHLHLPQERTHLNRSYQHRIPLCSTVGACICSMYMNVCAWERGMGVQLSPVGCDYFTTTNYSGKRWRCLSHPAAGSCGLDMFRSATAHSQGVQLSGAWIIYLINTYTIKSIAKLWARMLHCCPSDMWHMVCVACGML